MPSQPRHPGRRRVPLALAAAGALAVVLTACTSSDTGGGATASGPVAGTTPKASASATSAAPARPSASPTTTAPSARCRTADLRASIGPNDPGAGQENFAVVLTNDSGRTCTVYGFPGIAFVDGAGEAVTPDAERATGQEEPTVTLKPGASAWSALTFTNPAATGVTTVTPAAVLVTPPDETASIKVAWSGGKVSNTGKASVPQVSPLKQGDG
ncbi:DUF4232 domain-containing protein [Streptomyces sp. NBC_01275]|uniref:DUF4232 domain-containing protein n=1 Tax=Streptomyces sp. NBC_01275 TaxID=2903807 RepID=UPI0022522D2E|nr:DUF4232 domain-containing protein [Streptomyces sp. NBC_01275]MCX4766803.1 DUF4232 domain-containing protein [Streptomyces sp. NBC_01275]